MLVTDNATDVLQLCKALIYLFVLCVHGISNKLHCLVVNFDLVMLSTIDHCSEYATS